MMTTYNSEPDIEPDSNEPDPTGAEQEFTRARNEPAPGLMAEFADFLRHNKRWWLTPMILILLILSVMIVLTNTAILPAFYMLF